ncbi:hypothetical protein F5Y08DRAFT_343476 [Xylaria arbuscula]|nr:hypothetical protein F5Y08DRAFT_343476 [Xylaria arbuscula]
MGSMMVCLEQVGNSPSVQTYQLTDCRPGVVDIIHWNGDIGEIDLENGTQTYLSAYNCSALSNEHVFVSHYFNLTRRVASEDTSATSTSTVTRIMSSVQSMITTPTVTKGPAIVVTSHASPAALKNFAAAIIGGIGAGIGGAIVIVALVCVFPRDRKQRKS